MLVVHAQQGQRGQAEGTGEERKKHDFDRRKVGALDREASRGWHNRKLSMSSSSREKERLALAGARDSAFSVPWVLPPTSLYQVQSNGILYLLATLQNGEFDKRSFTARGPVYARSRESLALDTRSVTSPLSLSPPLSLSIRLEIFAHLSHKRNRFAPVYTQ